MVKAVPVELFVYGTSGFRAEASKLNQVVQRTAFYAAYRARMLGKSVGLMITASHNPAQDNGIKLVDPDGRMLPEECEAELTRIVNADEEDFNQYRERAMREADQTPEPYSAHVMIATDTRRSSPTLCLEAFAGVELFGCGIELFEHHTTPQLHFLVRACNDPNFSGGYVTRFRDAMASSFELIPFVRGGQYTKQLHVDCANGVGALWVAKYLTRYENASNGGVADGAQMFDPVELNLLNTQTEDWELLNHECGADFVKINARLPANFDNIPPNSRCASLDGDADRIVYFYPTGTEQTVSLLDGDHIAALFAKFIKQQMDEAQRVGQPIPLTFGVVQTAYANGNATRFFTRQLGLTPVLAKTGVKHLEEAARRFDIGVYFEANGHGTVCFSARFYDFLDSFGQSDKPRHIRLLALFSELVNDVVGDGIADMMAVECLLRHFDWSIQDWERHTYRDMPSVQRKVPVQERSAWRAEDQNETRLVRPEGIQSEIDQIVGEFHEARAFIRPSGTEQILRVYAEANTQHEACQLAGRLAHLIDHYQQKMGY